MYALTHLKCSAPIISTLIALIEVHDDLKRKRCSVCVYKVEQHVVAVYWWQTEMTD